MNYRFINPDQAQNVSARDAFFQSLVERGIQPIDVFHTKNGNRIQKRIFPGALVSMGVGETGVSLFKGNEAVSPDERLNQAIEGIEYELASAIAKLGAVQLKSIGFVNGHGELDGSQIISLKQSLQDQYAIESIDLNDPSELNSIDVIVVVKPEDIFTEVEKYNLDQYIMNGGTALFLIDMLTINEDSIGSGTLAYPSKQNLSDLLYRYGVRLNQDYVQDIVAGTQPVVVGQSGNQPQVTVLPWLYFPIINNFSQHIITRNINAIRTEYIGSIDSVMAQGIKKTPLLFSSQFFPEY